MIKKMWSNYIYNQVKQGRVERKPEGIIGKLMKAVGYVAGFLTLAILCYQITGQLFSYPKTDNLFSFALILAIVIPTFILMLFVVFKLINKK